MKIDKTLALVMFCLSTILLVPPFLVGILVANGAYSSVQDVQARVDEVTYFPAKDIKDDDGIVTHVRAGWLIKVSGLGQQGHWAQFKTPKVKVGDKIPMKLHTGYVFGDRWLSNQ